MSSRPPEVVAELAALGATHVHRVVADADPHLSAVLAEALASLLDATGAGLLLVVSSFENKEAAARLAVSTGAGVVTDADGLALVDGRYVAVEDRVRRHLEHHVRGHGAAGDRRAQAQLAS